MNKRVARRRIILAASHLAAGLLGITIAMVLPIWAGPFPPGFATATLGMAWLMSSESTRCEPDLVPWAKTLVAHRADLGEEDFAVEAAATLALLRDHGGEGLPESERRTLQDAATRCSSVLHAPCEGVKFERAVAGRCSTPRRHLFSRDAGAGAAPSDSGSD